MGGRCNIAGIGWKAGGDRNEVNMVLQTHNNNDTTSLLTFRSALGSQNRGLEIKPSFNIVLSGMGSIEFILKRVI
jgi:hypothetical protein